MPCVSIFPFLPPKSAAQRCPDHCVGPQSPLQNCSALQPVDVKLVGADDWRGETDELKDNAKGPPWPREVPLTFTSAAPREFLPTNYAIFNSNKMREKGTGQTNMSLNRD